mgnify:CR=1 FL=1
MDKNQEVALKQRLLTLAQSGQFVESEKIALYLLEILPTDLEVWFALAQIQRALGKYELALTAFERVVTKKSINKTQALTSIVELCINLSFFDQGLNAARKRLKVEPRSALAHYQFALLSWKLKRINDAAEHFKKAIIFEPKNAKYHLTWAEVLAFLGDISGAINQFEHTKLLDPSDDQPYLKSLMFQNYSDELSHEKIYLNHVEFGQRLESRYLDVEAFPVRDPKRKIRVAYLSTDFKRHSVSYFFLPIAQSYEQNMFELYCYSDMDLNVADEVTKQLQELSDSWRDVKLLSDDELYAKIRHDEIDILVDLTGYAGTSSRMPVFARKAAPIQVTYLGYPNTTGLSRMDYRIVDKYTDPVDISESQSSEKLIRLDGGFLCFVPDESSPSVKDLPVDNTGVFTFGSFNSYLKITDNTIAAWAEILKQVPDSQLYVKAEVFVDKGLQNAFVKRCKSAGIERKRLILAGSTPDRYSHLSEYHKVDLHLDTYPYNGTTTTLEALWMGVPTVTLAGGSHRSRVGNSILSNLGLTDFIATTPKEYIDIAVAKANDLAPLKVLRVQCRSIVSNSSLMDKPGFVEGLECFYAQAVRDLK